MASKDETKSETTIKIDPELETEPVAAPVLNLFRVDLPLRFLLFAATLTSVVLMVTSKQTKIFATPFLTLALDAKFNYSPALVYLVVANSTACLYSILTGLVSVFSVSKPSPAAKLLFALALFDVLMIGVVGSATGAGASIAYLGLKGNSHIGWEKRCDMYGKFCRYAGSSVGVSLVASIVLVFLVINSAYSLYHRSR